MAIAGAVAIVTATVTSAWGAYKASHAQQVKRLEETPGVKAIVTNPNTAPAAFVEAAEDPTRRKVDIDPRAPEKIS